MFAKALGSVIAVALILMIWLHPGIIHGVVHSVTAPVQAWIKNPDGKTAAPWMINPDDIKKSAGTRSDPSKDPGMSQKAPGDPGEHASVKTNSSGGKSTDLGESDKGYPAVFGLKQKTRHSTKHKQYTKPTLGVQIVAVQKAR